MIEIVGADVDGKSILESGRIPTQLLYNWLTTVNKSNPNQTLPSLHNIFLAKIQPQDASKSFTEQDTFNLRYDLRKLFRPKDGKPDNLKHLRHFIMGAAPDDKKENKTEDDRMAAKIKISRPYNENGTTVMRVWGWIPEEAKVRLRNGHEKDLYTNGWNREKVIDTIYQHLNKNYTLQVWREMNLSRDTDPPNASNAQSFLHSLLKLQESSHAES